MPNPVTRHIEPLLTFGPFEYLDSDTALLALTPSGTDVYLPPGTLDSGTISLALTASGTDAFNVVDTATAIVTFTPSGTDVFEPVTGAEDSGEIYFQFTITAIEFRGIETLDAGTAELRFDFAADDCHAILTPHWDIYISKRWQIEPPVERWILMAASKRWSVWIIGVAIDNPCPVPTFEAVF